jgi:hypothetical protein
VVAEAGGTDVRSADPMGINVLSLAPFPAVALGWTLAGGIPAITIVCKLTFPLEAGTDARLSPAQLPISEEDDLIPYKGTPEVTVTGFAYAPPGTKAPSIRTRLVVGEEVDKSLDVSGPRRWLDDGRASDPEPVDRVPLQWELAAGGPGTPNPVGVPAGGPMPPRIVRAGARVDRGVAIEPVGFGRLGTSWPTRSEKLGGAAPPGAGWATQPLPWTIDPAFFNEAPLDQRLRAIPPNESILLFGLLRDREKFGMRLPGVAPKAFLQNAAEGKEVPLSADTLRIDTERELVSVTWRGQVPVGTAGDRVVVALQERDAHLGWSDLLPRTAGGRRITRAGRRSAAGIAAVLAPPPVIIQAPPAVPVAPIVPPAPVLASAPMPDFIGRRAGEVRPEPAVPAARPPSPEPAEPSARDIVDLLWFEEGIVPRLRANRVWRKVIDSLDLVASNPGASTKAADEDDDRREVFQLFAHAVAEEPGALIDTLDRAISPDGKLDPPLVMAVGEIALPFDSRELLAVTLSAAKPLAPSDKAFKEVFDAVTAMADAGALSDPVAHGLTYRLREAFQHVKHQLGPRYLAATADRALLEGRRFQKRDVFGGPHVRALLTPATGDAVPAYLPVALTSRLPLFARFRARLLGELHAQVDSDETHPCAVRVLALARVVPRPGAARSTPP